MKTTITNHTLPEAPKYAYVLIRAARWPNNCIQLELYLGPVISTSLIPNNRLSRSENMVPVFNIEILQKVTKYCGEEYSTIFSMYLLLLETNYIFICEMWLFDLFFLNSANLICRDTDITKYFRESLALLDNESRLYLLLFKSLIANGIDKSRC